MYLLEGWSHNRKPYRALSMEFVSSALMHRWGLWYDCSRGKVELSNAGNIIRTYAKWLLMTPLRSDVMKIGWSWIQKLSFKMYLNIFSLKKTWPFHSCLDVLTLAVKYKNHFNPLWPSDAIWRHRYGSTLAQVMACCLTAPTPYLNQCSLIISKVRWHSYESKIFIRDTTFINH